MNTFLNACAAVFLVVYFLAACQRAENVPQPVKSHRYPIKTYDLNYSYVTEFRLEDGTHCVAGSGVGVTCDWLRQEIER